MTGKEEGLHNHLLNQLCTTVCVEQPLDLPGCAQISYIEHTIAFIKCHPFIGNTKTFLFLVLHVGGHFLYSAIISHNIHAWTEANIV